MLVAVREQTRTALNRLESNSTVFPGSLRLINHLTMQTTEPRSSPCSTLPTELFSPIFHHVLNVGALFVHASSEHEVPNPTAYYDALQNLRLVCVCWDQVAISTSSLWSLVDLGGPQGAVALRLTRSGAAPLSVVLHDPKADNTDLKQHAHRIRALRLSGTDQLGYLILEALFQEGMPLLRVLEMMSPKRLDFSAHEDYGPGAHGLQSLRAIYIKRLWLSSKFLSCTCLRYLHLYKFKTGTQFIGQLLSQNPQLTELFLGDITRNMGLSSPFRLLKLQQLSLSCLGASNTKECLTQLEVPSCTSWHIDLTGVDTHELGPIATELKKHFKEPSILLNHDEDATVKVGDGHASLTVSHQRIKYTVRLAPTSRLPALFKTVLQAFLVPLRGLKFQGVEPVPIELFKDEAVSYRLVDVQNLYLDRVPSAFLRNMFTFLATENLGCGWEPQRWPLPRLDTIEIRHDCDAVAIDTLHFMETRRRTDGIRTNIYGSIPFPLRQLQFKHIVNEEVVRKTIARTSWWNISIKFK